MADDELMKYVLPAAALGGAVLLVTRLAKGITPPPPGEVKAEIINVAFSSTSPVVPSAQIINVTFSATTPPQVPSAQIINVAFSSTTPTYTPTELIPSPVSYTVFLPGEWILIDVPINKFVQSVKVNFTLTSVASSGTDGYGAKLYMWTGSEMVTLKTWRATLTAGESNYVVDTVPVMRNAAQLRFVTYSEGMTTGSGGLATCKTTLSQLITYT